MTLPASNAGPGTGPQQQIPAQSRGRISAADPDLQVLLLLARGCGVAEVAKQLELNRYTANRRVERVCALINCQSRQRQAADYVARHREELGVAHVPYLTDRQQQVLDLITEGRTSASIAAALGVSESSVKTHTANLYTRIGVHNRVQAVRWAMNQRRESNPVH